MNIVIVDDFDVDREYTKNILKELTNININSVVEFEDGFSAVDYISSNNIDVVITDVQMPAMTGIELARQIKKTSPKTAVIFCSAYNSFEYIKQALYLDNYGYILKPIETDELIEALSKVLLKKMSIIINPELSQDERNDIIAGQFKEMILGTAFNPLATWDNICTIDNKLKCKSYLLCTFEIQNYRKLTSIFNLQDRISLSDKISMKIKEKTKLIDTSLFYQVNEEHIVVMYVLRDDCISEADNNIVSVVDEFINTDICINAYVSDKSCDFSCIYVQYLKCMKMAQYKKQFDKCSVLYYDEILDNNFTVQVIDYNVLQYKIRYMVTMAMPYDDVHSEITSYLNSLFIADDIEQCYSLCFFVVAILKSMLFDNDVEYKEIFKSETILLNSFKEQDNLNFYFTWIANSIFKVSRAITVQTSIVETPIILKVKKYINDNWEKNISVSDVATEMFYSPNYISLIFKRNTGESVFDYITKCKMKNAKILLRNPNYKLYQISNKLGYAHSAYFNTVFKKVTGITPKQFREQCMDTTNEKS